MNKKRASMLKYQIGDEVAAGTIVGFSDEKKKYLVRCRACGTERVVVPHSPACAACYRNASNRYKVGTVLPDGREIFEIDVETSSLKRMLVECVRCQKKVWKFSSTLYSPCFACSCEQKTIRDHDRMSIKRLYSYKHSANKRGYGWDLTDAEAKSMFLRDCHYCGMVPAPLNGIDRQDNSVGYTSENSVPCCEECNRAKGNMDMNRWTSYIDRLVAHNG